MGHPVPYSQALTRQDEGQGKMVDRKSSFQDSPLWTECVQDRVQSSWEKEEEEEEEAAAGITEDLSAPSVDPEAAGRAISVFAVPGNKARATAPGLSTTSHSKPSSRQPPRTPLCRQLALFCPGLC